MTARPPGPGGPVVGLDLGGTKIAAALVAPGGRILSRHTRPTPAARGPGAVLAALAAAVRDVVRAAGPNPASTPGRTGAPAAIGVAAAGVVDPRTGVVTSATGAIRGWAGTALGTGLADLTGLPVACDNDVRAAAGAEFAALGSGTGGTAVRVFAAVGTGVGGAVAVGGRMLRGTSGAAGHLGHLPSPEADGLGCPCGGSGHLEAIASGPGIARLYERLAGRSAERLESVAEHAAAGDVLAVRAITIGAAAAGRVLGGLANTLAPELVVVGGGVTLIGPLYRDAMTAAFTAELIPPLRGLRPVPPRLGTDAAVLGAAALTATAPLHHPGVPR